jgi:hypothetical protein
MCPSGNGKGFSARQAPRLTLAPGWSSGLKVGAHVDEVSSVSSLEDEDLEEDTAGVEMSMGNSPAGINSPDPYP